MSEGFEALLQGSQNLGDLVVLCSLTHSLGFGLEPCAVLSHLGAWCRGGGEAAFCIEAQLGGPGQALFWGVYVMCVLLWKSSMVCVYVSSCAYKCTLPCAFQCLCVHVCAYTCICVLSNECVCPPVCTAQSPGSPGEQRQCCYK